ncbi:SIMPL domain-containing protein [Pikeienuella piscinae]|uniref:SIMPL domain-containing protein n=1 Tax=Pikeienuella piscinae TaxID=2748098 RepID=A0A7L5BUY5_9RHOB|nr:SIMPL domain-containing protein [Pikeienuella piscinae]QIE54578.1 SIMPL domain-containing protein [Pikeienuella piscinae]
MNLHRPAALCAVLILAASAALADPVLTVRGEGYASAAPDQATVRIGVETRAAQAAEALSANSEAAGALIAAAIERGVERADIQTSGLSLRPLYDNRSNRDGEAPTLTGFAVSNEVVLRLTDVAGVGETLGVLVGAGANRLNGISFGLADDQRLMDMARRAAVADAQRKALLYAEAAGVNLGELVSIDEEGGGVTPRPMMRAMAESAVPPVEAGETTVSASVRMAWMIRREE